MQNFGGFKPTCKVNGIKSLLVYASLLISALFLYLKGCFTDSLLLNVSVFASFTIDIVVLKAAGVRRCSAEASQTALRILQ